MLSASTFVPGRHAIAAPRTQPAAHGLHVSNGTQQVLRMSRKKTYNVEVRIAALVSGRTRGCGRVASIDLD